MKTQINFVTMKLIKEKTPETECFYGGDDQNRTDEWEFCRLVPYRLATSPQKMIFAKLF